MEQVKNKTYIEYIELLERVGNTSGVTLFNVGHNKKGAVTLYEQVSSDIQNEAFLKALEKIILQTKLNNIGREKIFTSRLNFLIK